MDNDMFYALFRDHERMVQEQRDLAAVTNWQYNHQTRQLQLTGHSKVEREVDTISGTVAHRVITSNSDGRETWEEMGNCTCPSCRAYQVGFDAGRSSAPVKTEFVEVEVPEEKPKESPWIRVGDLADEVEMLRQERHERQRVAALMAVMGTVGVVVSVLFMLTAMGLITLIPAVLMLYSYVGATTAAPRTRQRQALREKELELKKAQRRAVATEIPPGID